MDPAVSAAAAELDDQALQRMPPAPPIPKLLVATQSALSAVALKRRNHFLLAFTGTLDALYNRT